MRNVTLALVAAGLVACSAARPVVYPNPHLEVVGEHRAQQDIDACIARAESYVEGVGAEQIATETAIGGGLGAAVGAAAGAAGGSAYGGAGGGAAAGAAGGAVAALLRAAFKSTQLTPAQRGFVNRCLAEQGYEVVGWQ